MKVLTFTSLYPNNIWPNHGVFIQERMANFAKLNECKVKVIAPVPYFPAINLGWRSRYSQVMRQEIREGLEVFHPRYFMTPKIGMSFYGLKMFFSVLPFAKKIRKAFDFDIIDAHYVYPDGFAAVLLGSFLKKPVVISARGSDINLFKEFPTIRLFLKHALRRANAIIAVSAALGEEVARLGIPRDKTFFIPNGVDRVKFYPVPRHEARKKLNIDSKRVILSVGHLTPNKGFDLVIKALKELYRNGDETELSLFIVGEGGFRKQLEDIASSLDLNGRVQFVGAVPHRELYQWFSAADVFCLPSSREGWPNVLLESLACGTPVVATRAGGIPEIIRSDKVGLLAERNERDIAKAISIGLKKEWNRDEIVRYASQHTWDKTAQSVYDVFSSVLDNRPSMR